MAFSSYSGSGGRGQTTQAVFMLLVLTLIGGLNLNILGYSIAMHLVPLIGICLWPRRAHPVYSIIAIFILGLLLDLLTTEALGGRTLIYLVVFSIFRPDKRIKEHIFGTALVQWLVSVFLVLLLIYFFGWMSRGTRPEALLLIYQAMLATAFFPLIYFIRYVISYILVDPDDRYL